LAAAGLSKLTTTAFDLDAEPVIITLPPAAINGPGSHTLQSCR
jgi:hypothetical protein